MKISVIGITKNKNKKVKKFIVSFERRIHFDYGEITESKDKIELNWKSRLSSK